jgi:Ca2+-binding EF-hand superfamily protein
MRRHRRARRQPFLADQASELLREAFRLMDRDGDGRLSMAGLRTLLLALGTAAPPESDLEAMVANVVGAERAERRAASSGGGVAEGGWMRRMSLGRRTEVDLEAGGRRVSDGEDEGLGAADGLTVGEFLQFMTDLPQDREPPARQLFSVFDVEQKGVISSEDLLHVSNSGFGMGLTSAEVAALIRYRDADNDNEINLSEFRSIIHAVRRNGSQHQRLPAHGSAASHVPHLPRERPTL